MIKGFGKIGQIWEKIWRRDNLSILIIIITTTIIFAFIGTIPDLAAQEEHDTAQSVSSISELIDNPINAPYKILAFVTSSLNATILSIRLSSFIFYVFTCLAMYFMLKHWHTQQVAVLATIAFATNSVVLATSRLGATFITVFAWFIFTAMLVWQIHSNSNKFVPILVLIGLATLLYTPGAIWFFLILGTIFFHKIKVPFKHIKKKAVIIGSIISILVLAPLVTSIIRDTDLLNEWLLIPATIDFGEIPRSILRVPSAFVYRMQVEPLINVGRLPIFDLAGGILFLIGLNAYRTKLSLDRTKVMIGSALVGIIIGALGQEILAAILLIPFAYSVLAAGIEYLLDIWNTVFPRNPIAKSFGYLMVVTVVMFGSYYHLTRFLVVWPQAPETRAVYNLPRIIE